jgi:hypothetical protein
MSMPYVDDYSWLRKKVLKYRLGSEPTETLLLYSSCVPANTKGRRLVSSGTIVCEITSGLGDGKYGPYEKTASDGRETVDATNQAYVLLVGQDVTLADRAVAGLWAMCVFNREVIDEVNEISVVSAELAKLKVAFPNAEFA